MAKGTAFVTLTVPLLEYTLRIVADITPVDGVTTVPPPSLNDQAASIVPPAAKVSAKVKLSSVVEVTPGS